LQKIRPILDHHSAVLLANSLVSSKLDFCNSLYAGLPASSIQRLQLIQNCLVCAIYPSLKRHDHISSSLRKLHWLPIQMRISFKIAVLTFKTLQNKSPLYLYDLIIPAMSNRLLLTVPRISSSAARRSFCFTAPTVWNSLPLELRCCNSLLTFRKNLKTYLFRLAYPP